MGDSLHFKDGVQIPYVEDWAIAVYEWLLAEARWWAEQHDCCQPYPWWTPDGEQA